MLDSITDIINILTAVIAAASAIAVVTPTKSDDAFLAKLKPFVNAIALNFGHAKSKS